jgi:hypothetical protein
VWPKGTLVGLPIGLKKHHAQGMLSPIGSFALALLGGWLTSPALFATELQLGPLGATLIRTLLRSIVALAILAASFVAVRF